jgi:polysaccharide biosynthesis/export protein
MPGWCRVPGISHVSDPCRFSFLAYFKLILMKIHEMQQLMRRGSNALGLVFIFFLITSINACVPSKKFVYFNTLKEDTTYPAKVEMRGATQFTDPTIQPNDILSITVQTLLQNETNAPVEAAAQPGVDQLSGFLVDKDGFVDLQPIGQVKVSGLTTAQAREAIKLKLAPLYKDPVVRVRIVNFEVRVLGDVNRPGVVNIPSEKATVLDVLALSGDLQPTAKRDNILLARTEGDKTTFVRLDLTKADIFTNPYFYVKQRDYIYVEPGNFKRQSSDNSFLRYLSYGTSLLGVVSFLYLTKIIK